MTEPIKLTAKDLRTDQEVRWCPGCGDYAILAAIQSFMPELGIERENMVFVSGIGCAARFPYYMNTYGMHSIPGRAPAIATGLAVSRPDLSVWVVTGDGDALSIGGNHLIHALRRNVNLKILLFNNQIYGLTKGQYSPTSELGKVTKSSPFGSVDPPFNPLAVALGAEATFVARTHDLDRKHMIEVFRAAHAHRGAAFVEIFQNCNVFNDGTFEDVTGRERREEMLIPLVHGQPIRFGAAGHRGVVTVVLDNPARKNAITGVMFGELREVFAEVTARPADRVVVITGEGEGAFCSGADLSSQATGDERLHTLLHMRNVGEAAHALAQVQQPVIAKINGVAVGAGLTLALGCDLLYASDRATFGAVFVRRGLSIDFGGGALVKEAGTDSFLAKLTP